LVYGLFTEVQPFFKNKTIENERNKI